MDNAELLYRAILRIEPQNSDALHNLGILLVDTNPDEALLLMKAALELNLRHGQYWFSFINTLINLGYKEAAQNALNLARKLGFHGEILDGLESRVTVEVISGGGGKSLTLKSKPKKAVLKHEETKLNPRSRGTASGAVKSSPPKTSVGSPKASDQKRRKK